MYRLIEQSPDSYESHAVIVVQKIGDEPGPQPFVEIVTKIPKPTGVLKIVELHDDRPSSILRR
jgi:hypothetical protein